MIRRARDNGQFARQSTLFALTGALLVFTFAALPRTVFAEEKIIWQTQIRPVEPKFRSLKEVFIILSFTNQSGENQPIVLPVRPEDPWFQWIGIYKEGERLEPKPDLDFGFRLSTVQPGETLSLLVPLTHFYQVPAAGPEAGIYELHWPGTTLGPAEDAEAQVEIDPALPNPPDANALDYYLEGVSGKDSAERRKKLWKTVLKSRNDPKWIGLLHILPAELIDADSLLKLAQKSDDLGILREAIRALGKIGSDQKTAGRLTALLKQAKDPVLIESGVESLQRLRR
ncbi:MAG: hypothetical protein COV74_05965 [Candidatus Omnitrophica bacterium CG11_big_fil_rev_8_21_14_0_20_45_26]|uniref:HEAT repeat domain-containing protein n=1 Tax=Candidatus Abzuiibacterium crystallinum TaxID=1974748 RepID=A0A2H0LR01_9BACT|nr:MAG: hypothetical protein COV74_05965 [Candidatus Omnitrophica bacterium CG11_big_fil_rev_8_21_14_0_20_45_26]PIW65297.1 MAG: hypothetical protein COW12_02470 [Candidatus Omnitrophica bacterium CG12_big_fil_rev_8_21_14_0_65_45_16]